MKLPSFLLIILLLTAVSAALAQNAAPTADANYAALRSAAPAESFQVTGLTLNKDIGVIDLRSGTITFLAPVNGRTVFAVFSGDGRFTLAPPPGVHRDYLARLSGKESVDEEFNKLFLAFTDGTDAAIRQKGQAAALDSAAAGIASDFRKRLRRRTENPRSSTEAHIAGDDVVNLDAEILGELYRNAAPGSFRAFIDGKKHGDLRFFLNPDGAFPAIQGTEEVVLLYSSPASEDEGIWYLSHFTGETPDAIAAEQKAYIDVEHYRIDTVVRGTRLQSVADLRLAAARDGDRVLPFGLIPDLRVSKVTLAGGAAADFIQEGPRDDGALFVILPQPLKKGEKIEIHLEYAGDKVARNAGGGSFYVGARTSWYPSVNSFSDRATFDLTFHTPKRYTLASVGKLVSETKDKDDVVTHWVSEIPLAVAGFNIGEYKKKSITEKESGYQIEGYATSDVPDYLHGHNISPSQMIDQTLEQTRASLIVFGGMFGPAPYGRIAITQQPDFDFGQSWPGLVYLPLSAFLDGTQRYLVMGDSTFGMQDFIDEVTPHEVAHQWWGHMVGWTTHHDQWLSEGFADFSAGLYLQATNQKIGPYLDYLERARKSVVEKNKYGMRYNDIGPIWLGVRLNTPKAGGAYSHLVYSKGGLVLHMLRRLMFDRTKGDAAFVAMMHDFVATHLHRNASTEDFQRTVEKHMLPHMNLGGNGKMDWFFREWIYGTDLPRYQFDYKVSEEGGKIFLTGKITQSEVSDSFVMAVPLYIDFDGRLQQVGRANLLGNASADLRTELPSRPKRVLINANHDVLASETSVRQID